MKKTFHQLHFFAFCFRAVCFAFFAISVYMIIYNLVRNNFIGALVCLAPIIIFIDGYIFAFYNRMIFWEDRIEATGNFGKKDDKIQFPDEINYSDIENIKVIYVNKNSRKKTIRTYNLGNLQPKLYFEILLTTGKTKWLFISGYSKRQRNEMLRIINSKTGKNFVYSQLEKSDLSFYKKGQSKRNKLR